MAKKLVAPVQRFEPVQRKVKKIFTRWRPLVFSRHPSHSPLRRELPLLPFRSVIRLGSTTQSIPGRIECNTVAAIRTSASKLLMKRAFVKSEVKTANWIDTPAAMHTLEFPIVAKHIYGSRGTGNYLLKTQQEYEAWLPGKTLGNYIFEKFYNFSREYRLHVTANGCFYTCRKVLREDTPDNNRWYRNDSNSNWILEDNPLFDKPVNWAAIVAESVKALKAVGLDVGAIDVKVQSAEDSKGRVRPAPEFIILETNSAPSFGERTLSLYLAEIPKILILKRK